MPSSMVKLKMSPRKRKCLTISEAENLSDILNLMIVREDVYRCHDYLSISSWEEAFIRKKGGSTIDEYCREQICEWTYRVVDYFRIDREVVSVSLNYLDRFLCTCSCDRAMFKLAATTCLYLSVKVVHPQKLGDLGILSDLSRGEFEMKDVSDMEEIILNALNWRLYPPTASHFTTLLLDFLRLEFPPCELDDLYSNASFFSELSVCDYYFISFHSSTIALASVLNALEGMMHDIDPVILEKINCISIPICDLLAARNKLWELYERSEECALHNDPRQVKPISAVHADIVSVDSVNSPNASPVSIASERHKGSPNWPNTIVGEFHNRGW
jgi:hypothetical protein